MINRILPIFAYITDHLIVKFMRYHSFRIDQFVKFVSTQYDFVGKKILDVGAESSPYKKYFSSAAYFTQDIGQNDTGTINYIGDLNLGITSIQSESFDYILCTQVLEHTYDPKNVFTEFNRVLRKGGLVFLTTHMVFDEHMEPHDYFRFTKYGLKSLGEKSDFSLEHIKPHGGIFQVINYVLAFLPIKLFSVRYSLFYYGYLVVFGPLLLLLGIVCYYLDFLDKEKTLTINYECIYKKN